MLRVICLTITCFIILLLIFDVSFAQEITITVEPAASSVKTCSGGFITHTLAHVTTVPGGDEVRMFEANGSGLAINDLDNDGDLDLVLGNHAGQNTILWNEGSLNFRTERMTIGDTRAINSVDLNGDGWLDLIFTRTLSAPNYWRNTGNGAFTQELLSGISKPLYTMAWADLDGDGDLDTVGGTYDAALLTEFGQEFLQSGDAGVYYYENDMGLFRVFKLANQAQALALILVDLNKDHQLDILVGNDFGVPDFAWYRAGDNWQIARPFETTSHSTMGFDFADINNDGQTEIFSTDMKPYQADPEILAIWDSILSSMYDAPPQIMANVLQMPDSATQFSNFAESSGVDASGWSWSGKFGDLDQDGFLDLYVVNGMIEATTFARLPNYELVEENQVFRNDGRGHFVQMPAWGLASTSSGRGMSMADLDKDGDLDIVVNNLRGPAQLFENQLCSGHSLQVDLRWPDSMNTHAIGAKLQLHTSTGIQYREIRSISGYLSGDPSRVHFGFPDDTLLEKLVIRWPDGEETSLTDGLVPDSLITIERP